MRRCGHEDKRGRPLALDSFLGPGGLPVIAALAGAVVGGIVAETRTMLQGYRERRKAMAIVLYDLLELRHQLASNDPTKVADEIKRYLQRKFGSDILIASGHETLLHQALAVALEASVKPDIRAHFERAVDDLAP